MGKYGMIFLILFFIPVFSFAQIQSLSDTLAYIYKIDYDVPESPAFSIIDANPSSVMRGSAAKEFVVNLANNYITNSAQETGVAVDFNPYFVFGGRLKSLNEYSNCYMKRLLANTQLSIASVVSDDLPNENLMSGGIRVTLFDNFDLLQDRQLATEIGYALIPNEEDEIVIPTVDGQHPQGDLVKIQALSEAYSNAIVRMKSKKGGAISIGAATAKRAKSGRLHADSLVNFRNQIWVSGQYSFGDGLNMLGLAMYRNTFMDNDNTIDEFLIGIGVRKIGKKVNVGGEIIYSSEKDFLELSGSVETKLFDNVLLAISIANASDDMSNKNNYLMIKPTLKYNLSQPGK